MMTDGPAARALATTTAALVNGSTVTDLLARMLRELTRLLSFDAGAVLVALPNGDLDILSASSHEAVMLELYQVQRRSGPCVDAIRSGAVVSASDADIRERWPDIGSRILESGFRSVHATPMHWQGAAFAGINLFSHDVRVLGQEELETLGTFADLATLAVITPEQLDDAGIATSVSRALDRRVVVEQAKGVISHREQVDMATAYERLVELAAARDRPLDDIAADVVQAAANGR
jgi:GAF domain-containing protein